MADGQRIEDLRRRVQKDPASIAFAQLAEECRRAGHYQESVDVCRAGLTLHPGYLSARVTLGRALIELNDLDVALAELEHVLKSAPENLAAIRGLAEIHHRQGSLSEALSQYRAALALARNDPDLQRTVEDLARQVEPIPPPASADGLSFEQMQDEFLQNLSAPPPPPPPSPEPPAPAVASEAEIVAPSPEPPLAFEHSHSESQLTDEANRDQGLRVVAVLGQWLDAIHVARAQSRT
jgi:tetratricopeptide (TPR) repeat protein